MTATQKKPARLPTIEEKPDADIVIYDGHCRFCTHQVQTLANSDGRGRLAFLSLHDQQVRQRWPDLTHEQLMKQMYVITPHGRRYAGAGALRYLTRRLPRLWPLAPLLHIPFSLPLWQRAYLQVALRRYRWGGVEACQADACKIHLQ
jgi:predicted DCC family thiol-disulfide oxidoreductase YuxK